MTVILAVSTRSYLWPGGASRSARAITSSASSSSSRPCRSSSASQSVQNPGPDAIRAAISAAPESSPRGAGGVDACVMTMANLAGNKAPGERKGVDNPVPTRSFVLFQGPSDPVTPPRPTCSQTVTSLRKPDTRSQKPGNFRAVVPHPTKGPRGLVM